MARRKSLKKVLDEVDAQISENEGLLRQAYQEGIRQLYPHALSALKKSPHKRAEILTEPDPNWQFAKFSYVILEDGQVIKRHCYLTREVRHIRGILRDYYLVPTKGVVETYTIDDFIEPLGLHDLEDVHSNLRRYATTLKPEKKTKRKEEERPEDPRRCIGYNAWGGPFCPQ